MERVKTRMIEWATASRAAAVGQESGDACLVHVDSDEALVAVADGLGHGPNAASAAREAIALLGEARQGPPVLAFRRCHEGLRSTRGAALSVAWFDGTRGTMTWMGVGSVEGVLLRSQLQPDSNHETLLLRGGVVGRQLPPLHASVVSVSPGDTLVLATDGIRPRFACELKSSNSLQQMADAILSKFGVDTDDAMVLVVRYLGRAA